MAVSVRIKHTYIGDLIIKVIPPGGNGLSSVILHNRLGGNRHNLEKVFDQSNTPQMASYVGKKATGTWTFRVEDKAAEDSGVLEQIEVQLTFPPTTQDGSTPMPRQTRSAAKSKISRSLRQR